MTLLRLLWIATIAIALSGCATVYRTPGAEGANAKDLAILEFNGNKAVGINPIEVDGKHRGNGFISRYELTAGEHTMTVALNIGIGVASKNITLGFRVDAGREYELKYEIEKKSVDQGIWRTWIEEKSTGQVVSSTLK
jgi:hypothetical protein